MIHENEDDLGYFFIPDDAHEQKPYNPWNGVSQLIVLNAILPREVQDDISDAAFYEHEGDPERAEECREYAGYSEEHLFSDPR